MSYLLDALKQSQQADPAQQHDLALLQQQQQQQLKRYRFLAISFGLILGFCLTLFAGFSIGKWLQSSAPQTPIDKSAIVAESKPYSSQEVIEQPPVQQSAKAELSQNNYAANNLSLTPPHQSSEQYQWVQVPVNTQPTNTQQSAVVANSIPQPKSSQPEQNTVQSVPVTAINPSEQLDLSKYKVLGKPMDQVPERKMVEAKQDEELEGVSENLKNAFAQAVADTDKVEPLQVTQGTKRSSYADPIELLPDGLHAMLPRIKYQAHIYSSTPDKRWIKLNNRELYEGDSMGDIRLLEITPEQSVLSFDGYEFSLKALQDWPE